MERMELEQVCQQFEEELKLVTEFRAYVVNNIHLMDEGLCAMAVSFTGRDLEERVKLLNILEKFKLHSSSPDTPYWFYTNSERVNFLSEIEFELSSPISVDTIIKRFPHLKKSQWAIPAVLSCANYVYISDSFFDNWDWLETIIGTLVKCYDFPDYKYFMQVFNIKNELSVEIAEWFEQQEEMKYI